MRRVGWDNCPDNTGRQVRRLVAGVRQSLGTNLIGIYLHGSLALGCFNPATSDIDLLVVTRQRLPIPTKQSLVELLLVVSNSPHPIEISFLSREDLAPWRYPTPFDLHYSEDRRPALTCDLATGIWSDAVEMPQTDPDLAAHIMVMRQRGIVLWGDPIPTVFPDVPRADYLASIILDLRWAQQRLGSASGLVYAVLNSCRVCAYLRNGRILSKDEGAVWALSRLPPEYAPLIRKALATYRGERVANNPGEQRPAAQLLDYVLGQATG